MKQTINQLDVYNHCISEGKPCDVNIEINPNLLNYKNASLLTEMGWLSSIAFNYQPPHGIITTKSPSESLLEYLNDYFGDLKIVPYANNSLFESNRDDLELKMKSFIELFNKAFYNGSISSGLVGRGFAFRIDMLPHYVKQYRNDNYYTNHMRRLNDISRCSQKYSFEYEIIDEELITSTIVADCNFKIRHDEKDDNYIPLNNLSILGKFSKSNQQFLFNEDEDEEKEDCIKLINAIIQAYVLPEVDAIVTIEHEGFRVTRKPLA